jgi:predicted  nucleic acid-binding Zn-ribbon protein
MIKTLIYKLLKYLLGIDIPKLLSDNQKLESSNSLLKHINIDSEKHNKLLNEQLHNKEELLLAAINELEVLKTENAALKTETTVAHSNLISLKAKKDEDLHANQTLTIEKEKLKENLKTLQGQILSVESRLNDSELKFTGQVNEISNLHEQLALIKANESKQSEIISELKKIESKYIAQKDEISNLNEQLIPYKESESNQSEMIRNLKERVSQLQAEAVNSKTKDNIIETLRKNIDSGNEKISALQSDIDLLRSETVPPVISHKEELSPKTLQKVDDVIVEHIGRNIGKRSSKSFETGENGFDYIGLFLFNLRQFNKLDSSDFPDVFYPKFNTPVLKWHKAKSNTTTGVTEPILMKAVNSIKEHAPDIEILTNIALSIRNRDYSYRPDLALFWPKHNLCIDIEIDEPYDIVSRKPLHYIGSSDYLRNLYFNSQGWVVIRFSEEQVNSKTEDCLKYISLVLKIITTESSFDSLLLDFKPEFVPRWTYEQAQEYAIDMYREKYLNLDTIVDLDPALSASL